MVIAAISQVFCPIPHGQATIGAMAPARPTITTLTRRRDRPACRGGIGSSNRYTSRAIGVPDASALKLRRQSLDASRIAWFRALWIDAVQRRVIEIFLVRAGVSNEVLRGGNIGRQTRVLDRIQGRSIRIMNLLRGSGAGGSHHDAQRENSSDMLHQHRLRSAASDGAANTIEQTANGARKHGGGRRVQALP